MTEDEEKEYVGRLAILAVVLGVIALGLHLIANLS